MDPTKQFISEIDAFLNRTGMKSAPFGKAALGDPNFVRDLKKKGRQPTLGVVGRVQEFIRANDRSSEETAA